MNFVNEAAIWDLHIHTNKCPKGRGSEFHSKYFDNTDAYLDKLIDVLTSNVNGKVDMISFTDHNQIDLEVYSKFYERNVDIQLIPGIEIDFLSSKDSVDPKHLIVYFDCAKENISNLCEKINDILAGTRNLKAILEISTLLNELARVGHNFIISPHAFKQRKRDIDREWVDETSAKKDASMYMDAFFAFWESAGYSSIQKAMRFLKEFELEDNIPIVSFSDSNNFDKLETYLRNPPQYFKSLPTFKGLAMVGTDVRRISGERSPFKNNRNPGMIKEVIFGDNTIQFSKQLNTIVGGRGSGKSILLDAIAHKLGAASLKQDRKKFIEDFPISIKNYNDALIDQSFAIDYFDQAYVNTLFSSEEFSKNLKEKFGDSFSELACIHEEDIRLANKQNFNRYLIEAKDIDVENLDALTHSYPIISNDGLNINIHVQDKMAIDQESELLNYSEWGDSIDALFDRFPHGAHNLDNLEKIKNLLKYVIFTEIKIYNLRMRSSLHVHNDFIDKYICLKESKSEKSKGKAEVELSIKKNMESLASDIIFRNNLINAYFKVSTNFKPFHSEYRFGDGSVEKRFIFSNELKVQTPFEYLLLTFDEYIDGRVVQNKKQLSLTELCVEFISTGFENQLKPNYSPNDLVYRLQEFDLEYSQVNNIYYVDNGRLIDISKESPGTQTNMLMEYIVHRRTQRPLLIDQPEDNVDNKTIYDQFRLWFAKLKSTRQVIVVTHDANIVINADAENVIVAEQLGSNEFKYRHGALEYQNIIEESSQILDGGRDAVERRLRKYEA